MILILGECRGNFSAAARLYREWYPDRWHPIWISHMVLRNFQHVARTICQI